VRDQKSELDSAQSSLVSPPPHSLAHPLSHPPTWPRWVTVPLALVIVTISLIQFSEMFRLADWTRPKALLAVYEWLMPLRSINTYGLFAVMTTKRLEIVIEGSNDGKEWLPYEFKYKPGDVNRRPGFVAPHQPRVDWQMWFAAL